MPKHQLCLNCGRRVADNYCPACGQRTTTYRLSWGSFVESFTSTFIGDEAYGLRGIHMRKGLVMTWLTILFRPYATISEYLEGHRRKYFNPVAILLMLSTFYAVVFMLIGREFTPVAEQGQPLLKWIVYTYLDYAQLHPAANMLLLLPFYALALKTVFRRKTGLRYVEFLYIGIFLSVFEITLMIVLLPAEVYIKNYHSFYMQLLPVFLYTAFVFWKLFALTKKGALLRTLLVDVLHYIYSILIITLLLLALTGSYYLIAPAQFRQSVENWTKHPSPEESGTVDLFDEVMQSLSDALKESDKSADTPAAAIPADTLPTQ